MSEDREQVASDEAGVPLSVQDLYDRYDRLITWAIRRNSRKLDPETLSDFKQQVYVRVIERDFLDRCRTYYGSNKGRFSSSLVTLVRNLVHRQGYERPMTDPLALRDYPHLSKNHARAAKGGIDDQDPLEYLTPVPSPEGPVMARNTLDVLGRRLASKKRRTSLRAVLDAALEHGLHSKTLAEATGANASTIRHYLVALRAEARSLETDTPWHTDATKSAGRTSGPVSPRSRN